MVLFIFYHINYKINKPFIDIYICVNVSCLLKYNQTKEKNSGIYFGKKKTTTKTKTYSFLISNKSTLQNGLFIYLSICYIFICFNDKFFHQKKKEKKRNR